MKKFTLVVILSVCSVFVYAKVWTVSSTISNTFSPATLSIAIGDSVQFNLSGIHSAVEVDQNAYNNNQLTPLSGGFSVPFGGGLVPAAQLPLGTHYYVCGNHFSLGMKGIIMVTPAGVPNISASSISLKIFPNPYVDKLNVQYHLDRKSNVQIKITDLLGNTVATLSNEIQQPGDYAHIYDQLPLVSKSNYFLDFIIDGKRTVQKLMVE